MQTATIGTGIDRETSFLLGGGVTIMTGTGQSIKNVQDITVVIKVYDGGVVSGDLTLSDGRDWTGTM